MKIEEVKSPIPEQVRSSFRALLLAIGGYVSGKGYVDGAITTAAIGFILVVVPWGWNQMKIRERYSR